MLVVAVDTEPRFAAGQNIQVVVASLCTTEPLDATTGCQQYLVSTYAVAAALLQAGDESYVLLSKGVSANY